MDGNLGGWQQEGCLQQEPEGQQEGYRPRQFVPVQQQQPMIIVHQPQQAAPQQEEIINRIKSVILQHGYRVEYETKAEETRKIQQQEKDCCTCCDDLQNCGTCFCLCLILCIAISFFPLIGYLLDSVLQ